MYIVDKLKHPRHHHAAHHRNAQAPARGNKNGRQTNEIKALNKTLNPACDLSGLFLPVEAPKQFNVMFVAEMPSMNVPKGWVQGDVIPNFSETARDRFLQDMMVKYGVGGSYVTDIVKTRDYPRQSTRGRGKPWAAVSLKRNRNSAAAGLNCFGQANL